MNNVFIVPVALRVVGLGFKDISVRCQSTKQTLPTFYDVLNLKPGCTKKEIRDSFIKLSKLNHPDVCGPSSNDRFVRINDAYNVLIDDNKKRLYDETLINTNKINPVYYYHYPQRRKNNESWKDIYNNPSNHWLSSNVTIALVCVSMLLIGTTIQFYGVKKSTILRSLLTEESDGHWSFLEEQKLRKIDKTNDELVQIFEKKYRKRIRRSYHKKINNVILLFENIVVDLYLM